MMKIGRFGRRKVKRISYVVEVVDRGTESVENLFVAGTSLSEVERIKRRLRLSLDRRRYFMRMRIVNDGED